MRRWIMMGSAAMAFVAITGTASLAQTDIRKDERLKQPIVLDFKDIPITTALEVLFKGTGVSYSIDSNVTGTVRNIHMEAPFEPALKALLRSVVDPPLIFKVQKDPSGDQYIISVKKPEPPIDNTIIDPNPQPEPPAASADIKVEKISLNNLDAYVIKDLIEGKDTRSQNGQGGIGGFGGGMMGGMMGSSGSGGFGSSFGGGFGSNGGSSWGGSSSSGSSWGGGGISRGF